MDARQRLMRAMVADWPINSREWKIGGLIVPPLTATRMGWATLPRPSCLASQYVDLHNGMVDLNVKVAAVKLLKTKVVEKLKTAGIERIQAEKASGEHWRAKIFEKQPTDAFSHVSQLLFVALVRRMLR